jgi:hypothetical protein
MKRLEYEDFPETGYIKICDIKYNYELFEELGINGMPVGTHFEIIQRKDGSLSVQRHENPTADKR